MLIQRYLAGKMHSACSSIDTVLQCFVCIANIYITAETFHRSGPASYGHDLGEDNSEEEGERYLMHLACYHG